MNLNHVPEANFASRNVANSVSRDVFESLVFNSTSVHVDRMNPVLGASSSSFYRCRLRRLRNVFLFHR